MVLSLVGCSAQETSNPKSEEELRAEIKAELEAEAEQQNEQATDQQSSDDTGKSDANNSTTANTYRLSGLNDGDTVGSFTIGNITTSQSEAKFDLQGNATLTGEIYYDDFTSSLWFEITDNTSLPAIVLDSINENLSYKPGALWFKNYDSFYNSLPASTVKEIKENFQRVSATIKVKNLSAWAKSDYNETGCEFVSLNSNSGSSTSSSNTTPPTQDNPQPKSQLLGVYEANKEYQYDLDGDQKIDTFSLESDGSYIDLFINEWGYSVALESITPELLYFKYKLINIYDSNKYALALYVASPPNDYEVYFLEYEYKGYDKYTSGQKEAEELKVLGVATVDLGMFNYEFDDFFNCEAGLSRSEANFAGEAFIFGQ